MTSTRNVAFCAVLMLAGACDAGTAGRQPHGETGASVSVASGVVGTREWAVRARATEDGDVCVYVSRSGRLDAHSCGFDVREEPVAYTRDIVFADGYTVLVGVGRPDIERFRFVLSPGPPVPADAEPGPPYCACVLGAVGVAGTDLSLTSVVGLDAAGRTLAVLDVTERRAGQVHSAPVKSQRKRKQFV